MIKRVLTLVNAVQCTVLPHITASVFTNDDESGLHQDYEVWLAGAAPRAPIGQCRSETGCTTAPAEPAAGRSLPTASLCPGRMDRAADAHLKRHGPPSAAVVVAVTNGRLDSGAWERILGVSWIADT